MHLSALVKRLGVTSKHRGKALEMRIVTWNVNSLSTTAKQIKLKYGSMHAFFSDVLNADVVALQVSDSLPVQL